MKLDERLDRLTAMTPSEVKAEWRRAFGTPAPPAFGIALTTRAIAARYQEQALGGLTRAELRMLEVQARRNERKPKTAPVVKPGTWLSRTWHGEVHEVVVLDGAYEYRGSRFASLSAIAREITGAHWSGPRFFGLHSPRLGSLKVDAGA
ncbi:DUF2924 domain-containing protein [Tsuneonella mangrovi]|uniref:DUF2924 domain-containing protein n=1 Tax=Tsuneonella mangrovi TaxID=1982042 RepID=UPI00196AEEC9|nr:DUF2924 domain-containing protein [Tsuneonella mangrovi]